MTIPNFIFMPIPENKLTNEREFLGDSVMRPEPAISRYAGIDGVTEAPKRRSSDAKLFLRIDISQAVTMFSWGLSLAIHIVLIVCFLPAYAKLLSQSVLQAAEVEPTFVEVEVLANPLVDMLSLSQVNNIPAEGLGEAPVVAKAENHDVNLNEGKKKAIEEEKSQKYEQVLARHFSKVMPARMPSIKEASTAYIWVKINRQGDILDHGYKPDNLESELASILEHMSRKASPLPPPPAREFNKDYVYYAIPISMIPRNI